MSGRIQFDPIDLVQLAAGFAEAHKKATGDEVSVGKSEFLVDVAELLETIWLEVDDHDWTHVWAYDVAYSVGYWIGEKQIFELVNIEAHTRALVSQLLKQ